jgi:hypothetical protein
MNEFRRRRVKRLRMRDVRVALCGSDKLPRDYECAKIITLRYNGNEAHRYRGGTLTFHVRKQPHPMARGDKLAHFGGSHASGHRVLVDCPQCGKIVPAGRLHQHEGSRSCHELALNWTLNQLEETLDEVKRRDRVDFESAHNTIETCLRDYGFSREDTVCFVLLTEEVSPHLSEETALRRMREIFARYPDIEGMKACKPAVPDMSDAPKDSREEVPHD